MAVALHVAPRQSLLQLLVLSGGRAGCVGVDLESGGLVLAQWPARSGAAARLHRFDVAAAVRVDDPEGSVFDPARPDAIAVERPVVPVGRMRRRAAERFLRPLLLPERSHLLGFAGMSVPYWTLTGDRPSLCLVAPVGGMAVGPEGTVAFGWKGVRHELPLADPPRCVRPLAGTALAERLGFVPRRVLVALTPPRQGLCHKFAATLLP